MMHKIIRGAGFADCNGGMCCCGLAITPIESISKETNCAEHEYMNMPPSLIELMLPLPVLS